MGRNLTAVLCAALVTSICSISLTGCRENISGLFSRLSNTEKSSAEGKAPDTLEENAGDGMPEEAAERKASIIPPKDPITLSFVGDIMAHNNNFNMPDYSDIYKNIKEIFLEDDFTFGNLEFPVCGDLPMSTFPMFNVHPPYVEAAIEAGFDIFSCANNHSTDKGPEGVKKTYTAMKEFERDHGIYFSGIRKDTEKPFRPEYIQYKRWKIGFLAATEHLNSYRGSEYTHVIDYHDAEVLIPFLELLREETKKYDLFILSFHGGKEYGLTPYEKKADFFDKCLASGVDIVWAHHPHVLQPWSLIKGPAGDKLVFYSAGNFISGQTWFLDPKTTSGANPYTGESAVFQVHLRERKGRTVIHDVSAIPIANYKHPEEGMIVRKHIQLTASADVPEFWRRFYSRRLPETAVLSANYAVPNILP